MGYFENNKFPMASTVLKPFMHKLNKVSPESVIGLGNFFIVSGDLSD
jgi:hypothetical protein